MEQDGETKRRWLIERLVEGKRGWVERLLSGMNHVVSSRI